MKTITIGSTTMTMEEFKAKVDANRDNDGFISHEVTAEEIDPDLPQEVRVYLAIEQWYKNSNVKPEDRVSVKDIFPRKK